MLAVILNIIAIIFSIGTLIFLILFIKELKSNPDKKLEEISTDDYFDLKFSATNAFEQDFTFDFEDYDEMQAFIDTNHDQLDNYKEEYPSVMNWIEAGMIC